MTPDDLKTYANAIAANNLDRATLADCSGPVGYAHHLGTALHCPACWAWHKAQKTGGDGRAYIVQVLGEQAELAGEVDLAGVAALLVEAYASGEPTEPAFWERLAAAVSRGAQLLLPTSRRRKALTDLAAIFVSDPSVQVGR